MNVLPGNVDYFRFADIKEGYYNNVTEVDLNKAYWILAHKMGYLSKEIYEEGLTVDKMTRLIAWGSIAASARVYRVDHENRKQLIEEKVNRVTRSYFFDVAHELGQHMSEVLSSHSQSVLFYWVDAFFIKGRSAPAIIQKEMAKKGLPCKVVPLWNIQVKNKSEFSDLITVTMAGGKEKPFHRKKGNRQLYQFQEYCNALELEKFIKSKEKVEFDITSL